jgi:hypothetical protein
MVTVPLMSVLSVMIPSVIWSGLITGAVFTKTQIIVLKSVVTLSA